MTNSNLPRGCFGPGDVDPRTPINPRTGQSIGEIPCPDYTPRNVVAEPQEKLPHGEAEAGTVPSGLVCYDCAGTGWLENRYPCTCMTEAEPYQILLQERNALALKNVDLRKALLHMCHNTSAHPGYDGPLVQAALADAGPALDVAREYERRLFLRVQTMFREASTLSSAFLELSALARANEGSGT